MSRIVDAVMDSGSNSDGSGKRVKLYAIMANEALMELCVADQKQKQSMEALLQHVCKKIRSHESKLVSRLVVESYSVYYFQQDSYLFLLATQSSDKPNRMKNYLRVVADIFYENYDENNFHYVLEKIMNEINRIEGVGRAASPSPSSSSQNMEDEQSELIDSFKEQKKQINDILLRHNNESRLAYVISTVLFACIVALGIYYISKKWL